jgi:monoamine oxidase
MTEMTDPPEKTVLILGAGFAGLAAGYCLTKRGYSVTVLEARDRIGGRIDTRILDTDPPVSIEMGAEWVGMTHKRMQTLCKEFGLQLINHSLSTNLLYKGKYCEAGKWKFSHAWKEKLHELRKSFPHLTEEKIKELEETDWWHFLTTNHIPQHDIDILDLIESTDYGEDIRFVASYDVLSDFQTGGLGDTATYARIDGGNKRLIEALAGAIGMDAIHREHVVAEIAQHENDVTVRCANGSIWKAQHVICTLPAPAVSAIQWTPGLPDAQKHAYQTLNYCRIIKVSVLFSHRFWKDDFEMATDTLADFIYHSTQNQPGEKGVLTSYAVGDRAYVLSHQSDEEKIKTVCAALGPAFGDVLPFALGVTSYYWGDDPYTGGAYALFEKDPLQVQEVLRAPHGCVLFAGEHVAELRGFMEGAVESGELAAKKTIEAQG